MSNTNSTLWESKLAASRALEPADPEPQVATQPGGNIPYQLMAPQQAQIRANGQYILTLPTGVSQGQMVNLPQQTIIQGQPGQVTQIQGQALPQFDGAHDEPSTELSNEPLNSDDDVSEEDPSELFDTDNVVVCQFEKISRNKGKWKFLLKDGIMNLDGKDHIFQRGTGEADCY
ncbi:TF2AA-like protein [Mya arenaria]|uniref:TF2AA-like protein n=1 Tax=Mya arenaria TaxID=6604 RepID=A0ABY7FE92_MYAAR|nr:TF2AA-like protein [Mya arenaria]